MVNATLVAVTTILRARLEGSRSTTVVGPVSVFSFPDVATEGAPVRVLVARFFGVVLVPVEGRFCPLFAGDVIFFFRVFFFAGMDGFPPSSMNNRV